MTDNIWVLTISRLIICQNCSRNAIIKSSYKAALLSQQTIRYYNEKIVVYANELWFYDNEVPSTHYQLAVLH